MKIRRVGAVVFHSDGQTGMKKLIDAFRIFANVPESGIVGWMLADNGK